MGNGGGKPFAELSASEQQSLVGRLFDAVKTGQSADALRQILSKSGAIFTGADLDKLVEPGTRIPLLYRAVVLERDALVRVLLEAGCRPRCCDNELVSALHRALEQGSKNIAETLLEFGTSDVTLSQDFRGRLPLHYVRIS